MLKALVGFTVLAVASVSAKILEPHDVVSLPRPGGVVASPNGRLAVYGESVYHADNDKVKYPHCLLHEYGMLIMKQP